MGVIAYGGLGIGLLAFGGGALALVAAFGGGVIAPIALGGGAIGYFAYGGLALGAHVLDGLDRSAPMLTRVTPYVEFAAKTRAIVALAKGEYRVAEPNLGDALTRIADNDADKSTPRLTRAQKARLLYGISASARLQRVAPQCGLAAFDPPDVQIQ